MSNKRKKIFLPKNLSLDLNQTKRSQERQEEDEDYLPVIVKRNDESVRHPDDTLEKAIEEGLEQHKRSKTSLFLSSVAAGLILGFAAMLVALMAKASSNPSDLMLGRLPIAFVYPLGFIVCIMSGSQLFTEHTATAVYPVLDRKASISSLFQLWSVVLLGNLFGTLISAFLITSTDSVIGANEGYLYFHNYLLKFEFKAVFLSSILAGWLMAQGGWLTLSTPPSMSQIICIYIVTFIIGFGGLHHSIAGSAKIFGGLLLAPTPQWMGAFQFLTTAILGNLVGGSVFVAVLNYAHIRHTQ